MRLEARAQGARIASTDTTWSQGIARARRHALTVSISGTFALQCITRILQFLTGLVLARTIGASGYGAYAYGMAWVGFLQLPAVLGMDRYLTRALAMYEARREWGLLRGLLRWANRWVLIVSTALAVAAIPFGLLVVRPDVRTTFCLAMPLVPFTALVTIRQGAMAGLNRVASGQIPEFLVRPLLFLLTLLGLDLLDRHAMNAELVMVLNILSVALAFALGVYMLQQARPQPVRSTPPTYVPREWLTAALPMMLLGGMWMVNAYVGTIMLGSLGTAQETGIYTVVSKGADLVTVGLLAVTTPISPRIARQYASGDLSGMQRTVSRAAALCLAWSLPAALGLFLLRHVFLGLFGSAFSGASTPLLIMLLGQLSNAIAGPAGIALMMTRHERAAAVGVGLGCILNIILNLALVPSLGVNGAAIGTAASLLCWNLALAGYAAVRMGLNTTAFFRPSRLRG